MEANDLLDMKLREVSDYLCERLIENKKEKGVSVAGATLDGTNKIDGKRVQLSIVLSEKALGCDDCDCED